VNRLHRLLCASGVWRGVVRDRIVPWVLDGIQPGSEVLEIGAGPGAATEALHDRVAHLTCVEIDAEMAAQLSRRVAPHGVTVLCQDATATRFPDTSFDAVLSFSMLHHLPSAGLQDRLFSEVFRLLRPGGVFAGFDIRATTAARIVHAFDTMVPIHPPGLPHRLLRAGFIDAETTIGAGGFRFRAHRG
jgi:SAM-dependent methyltransferase